MGGAATSSASLSGWHYEFNRVSTANPRSIVSSLAIAWVSGVTLGAGRAVLWLVSPTLLAMLLGGALSLVIVRAPGAGPPPSREGGESTPAPS